MNSIINKLKTPDECAIFEANALERGRPDLALDARKRAVELQAQKYSTELDAERECYEVIFAYEQVLSAKNRKKTRATRTWQMVQRHGIIEAAQRAVNRREDSVGYSALSGMGLQSYTFEAVILRHPHVFSKESVERSHERMNNRVGPPAIPVS